MIRWLVCCFKQSQDSSELKSNKILTIDESDFNSSLSCISSSYSTSYVYSSCSANDQNYFHQSICDQFNSKINSNLTKVLIIPFASYQDKLTDKYNPSNQASTLQWYGSFDHSLLKPEINFDITYNKLTGVLNLFINYCRNLPIADYQRHSSNPYVQIYILPDTNKTGKRRTKTKWDTVNPNFDEKIVPSFDINLDEFNQCKLWLTVWHSNSRNAWIKTIKNNFTSSKKICLGEVTIPLNLNEVCLMPNLNYILEEPKGPFYHDDLEESIPITKGVISIKLKFVFEKNKESFEYQAKFGNKMLTQVKSNVNQFNLGSLEIKLCGAKDLPVRSTGKPPRPYCKCYLFSLRSNSKPIEPLKQKTPIANRTCNPKWNHTLVYQNFSLNQLKDCCLEVHVWDHNNKFEKTFLGGLRLCNYHQMNEASLNNNFYFALNQFDEAEKEIWKQILTGRDNVWFGSVFKLRYFSPINKSLSSLFHNDNTYS